MQIPRLRWWIVTLVALATVINYIDRQSLNVLWPEISAELYPDRTEDQRKEIYALISVIFVFAYAFGQAIFGKIFDWIGTRMGFALSIAVWSLATAAHAFARGLGTFALFRAILGAAEAGNWPGATKANAEWFPTKERALAQGIFNSGAAIGGIVSIPLIAFLSVFFDWHIIFIIIGLTGLLWLIPWMVLVKAPPGSHPWVTEDERQYILTGQTRTESEGDSAQTPAESDSYAPGTVELLSRRQSWGVIIASAAIDPIWWLFVFWIPIYLSEVYGFNVREIGIYGWVPYVGAMFGAWFGGLLAQNRIKAGWSVDGARKLTITLGCLIMLPCLLAMSQAANPVVAVLIMAAILFGFQTAIGNVQTLASDFLSGKSVGTLAGFAGMAAKLGAAGLTYLVPWLTMGGNYTPAFIIGAGLALLALASVWIVCGRIEPLKPKKEQA
ncbi:MULTISPECIES: MFS transporter [Maricaulis]|jgi:ACS family hexuronate transporter-like MFS transporter|uniref:Major facilitator superfamily MFS_1 n=1 Tax=Maricaulis maris (strain MCS10) TaxID=394221 RepID=Q0AT36_MARMM|nr:MULTISPECIES: MFS transporter [Maricaulis]ABI64551.1 major facilitator superfamily MFS_1 [Maricaulis maris MCS10]MAC89129.1 MFS transporter [Maricaulis sp.]